VATEGDPHLLARRLLELLERAPKIRFTGGQVRVDKATVHELVAALREGSGRTSAGLLAAAEAVDDAVRDAQPVPLTDQIRLPGERVANLAAQLRAAGA
jgi:hypothetical protein